MIYHRTLKRLAIKAAELAEIGVGDIYGPCRSRDVAWTRFAVMNEAHRRGYSLTRIGDALGRDHTSVMHGVRRADELSAHDADMCDMLAALRNVQ